MAKKKKTVASPPESKTIDRNYLLAQLTEDRNAVCKLASHLQIDIGKVHQRIDRLVAAIDKSRSVRGI